MERHWLMHQYLSAELPTGWSTDEHALKMYNLIAFGQHLGDLFWSFSLPLKSLSGCCSDIHCTGHIGMAVFSRQHAS